MFPNTGKKKNERNKKIILSVPVFALLNKHKVIGGRVMFILGERAKNTVDNLMTVLSS